MRAMIGFVAAVPLFGAVLFAVRPHAVWALGACAAPPATTVTVVTNDDNSVTTTTTENYRGVENLTHIETRYTGIGTYVSLSVPEWLSAAYADNLGAIQSDIDRGLLRDRRQQTYIEVCRAVPSDQAIAHRGTPTEMMSALMSAQATGDVETGVALFAEGAIIGEDFRAFDGSAQVRSWLQWTSARNFSCAVTQTLRQSETSLSQVHRVSHDDLRRRGISYVDMTISLTVEQGRISSYRSALTPDSMARVRLFNGNQTDLIEGP